MDVSLVVAVGRNRVIGNGGRIPWWSQLPADMKHFRELTLYHPVIMGRKTMESIVKPLPERLNIVLAHSNHVWDGFVSVKTPDEAIHFAQVTWKYLGGFWAGASARINQREEVLVIGGGEIYRLFLDNAARIYMTLVDAEFLGDTFFPELPSDIWEETGIKTYSADERNKYRYSFVEFRRK